MQSNHDDKPILPYGLDFKTGPGPKMGFHGLVTKEPCQLSDVQAGIINNNNNNYKK